MILKIDSPNNEKVKLVTKLVSSAKARRDMQLFVLEGVRLTSDAVLSGVPVRWFFFTEAAIQKFPHEGERLTAAAEEAFIVTDAVAQKLSDTEHPQGFFCVCRRDDTLQPLRPDGKYVALENIQDPANLGAICRTAEALGVDGAILSGCCDATNPKAQRAAMGSLLRLPLIFSDDLCRTLRDCSGAGMRLFSTTPASAAKPITEADFSGGCVVVIGNEGNGVTQAVADLCEAITIPMRGRAESLNASAAAALTMWEMLRPR